jgi:hypothetical protein
MGWSRDENTQNLAERWRWDVDPRDDSRIARQLHRTPWPIGVYRLDKRAWREDCFHCLPEPAALNLMNHVQGKAFQREVVPVVQSLWLYGLKTLLTVDRVHALPTWLCSAEVLLPLVSFKALRAVMRQRACARGTIDSGMRANNIVKQKVPVVWLTHILRARDERAMRLIQLLSVGWRVLRLTEFIVHREAHTNHSAADSRALPTSL